ncbi:neutrophil gelatinase-associated lipocalin [Erinaceus europaeus]|uniref:Neutrophil gelatinase-associated lipocalin n=1 Tax=Erinaceus europaeus TaxID=9365 RepID=A0A1S3WIM1_ERIEU|nr:neutrophil gelatinase-associated lipocalin [Erinaceus europaeus]
MPRALLWLGFLCLLGSLLNQAHGLKQSAKQIRIPHLSRIPLEPNFQADQFQGKWYVVGLAGNNIRKEEQGQFNMYATNYQLKEDQSYNVTSILFRNQSCDYWVRTFVPSSKPGQFTLGNIQGYPELRSYTVRVASTDYNQFAMVFFKKVDRKRKAHFKITLYGRTKELTPELKNRFTSFAKSLGLTDDYIIFPVPIDQCIDQ